MSDDRLMRLINLNSFQQTSSYKGTTYKIEYDQQAGRYGVQIFIKRQIEFTRKGFADNIDLAKEFAKNVIDEEMDRKGHGK